VGIVSPRNVQTTTQPFMKYRPGPVGKTWLFGLQKTEEDAQCNIDALCRDFVSMQRAILQQMAPVSTPDADNGQKPFQGCSLRKDELKES
jgi:hypothetical protein